MLDHVQRKITPVILAGGSGTRLWPVSRKSFPKQFASIIGHESLFQATARRVSGSIFAAPLVVTNTDFRFIVADQLDQTGISGATIIVEPVGRNTAPAILAAAQMIAAHDPQGLVLVTPSDHMISDAAAFMTSVEAAAQIAQSDKIVVFGVRPDRPSSAYGYLELASDKGDFQIVQRFIEKPSEDLATQILARGNCLWNAGIFLFQADAMIDSFRKFAPDYLTPVQNAVDSARCDARHLWLASSPWEELPDMSIDYAVMEKADNIAVVPLESHWADLGGWDAVWQEGLVSRPTEDSVVADAGSTAIDCQNVLMRSDDDLQVVGIGLKDTVVVATRDAVLVADMNRAQDVRLAVDALNFKKQKQAVEFPRTHRPWGSYEVLARADRFQVKRIVVEPGASLSLQKHMHRAEHWIVVSGTAEVTIDREQRLVTENQSIYVPLGSVHRMSNPGKVPMVLIEVQTGVYLEEDDILRFHDIYARPVQEQVGDDHIRVNPTPVSAQETVIAEACYRS